MTAVQYLKWQELRSSAEEVLRLDSTDARQREVWADDLGDLLESACLQRAEAEQVLGWLVQMAVTAGDHAVRESALHAVAEAGVPYELPYSVVEPLADNIAAFEPLLLEYVLFSLSATHDERARGPIEPFLAHPDPDVRREARFAMAELGNARG
ncbi:HEAT repeat domain-containing protein [Streptomyces sp. NPDC059679]|uniref:HEAT repeat domain-containing protein n=1 Tax=Streptomyces sp. NPDC059679 TaxID=3346903 RepID=UPI0036BA9AA4